MSFSLAQDFDYYLMDGLALPLGPAYVERDAGAVAEGLPTVNELDLNPIIGGDPLMGDKIRENFARIGFALNNLNDKNFSRYAALPASRILNTAILQKQVITAPKSGSFTDYDRIPRLDQDGYLGISDAVYSLPTGKLQIDWVTAGGRLQFKETAGTLYAELTAQGWFDGPTGDPSPVASNFTFPTMYWDWRSSVMQIITAQKTLGYIDLAAETVGTMFTDVPPEAGTQTLLDFHINFDEDNDRFLMQLGDDTVAYIDSSGLNIGKP